MKTLDTLGPANFGTNFTVIQRLSSLRGKLYCHGPVGTTELVLYRDLEVKCIFQSVL